MAMTDTEEMQREREAYVPLDVVKCACGRVYLVRRGKEENKCICGKKETDKT